jgi:DNA/RNA-binding domain of Phe-tRNA-synthetase-like protein
LGNWQSYRDGDCGDDKEATKVFIVSKAWKTAYPGAAVGVLAMRHVTNPERHTALDKCKEELENQLRSRFSDYDRAALKAIPTIRAYNTYYKRYKKTYHVQLQLESVVFKSKSIPRVAALVEAMFMAELKNLLLTAGHDLEAVQVPVRLDVARGTERYIRLNGQEQQLKAGDMMIADAQGVISSVIYGPDRRTQITSETRQVLFTVYAPSGIGEQAVHNHLQDIQANILLIAPEADVELLEVYGTG